jgi:hypothetical protein
MSMEGPRRTCAGGAHEPHVAAEQLRDAPPRVPEHDNLTANVFRHPQEVAHHPWFTDREKRAVLLSWARDELMAEQLANKAGPEFELTSCIDAVVDVLAHDDPLAAGEYRSALATVRGQPKEQFRWKAMH